MFIIILISTFIIALIPSIIVGSSTIGLILPKLYPPAVLFPIVWSILYLLMSISIYIVSKDDDNLFLIYYIQVVINSLWSVIFFGFKLRLFGFIWIVFLLLIVLIMIKRFYDISKLSLYLLIPYVLWLGFAGYLNLAIYLLNR